MVIADLFLFGIERYKHNDMEHNKYFTTDLPVRLIFVHKSTDTDSLRSDMAASETL